MLLPIDKRNELDDKYIIELVNEVFKLPMSTEAKISFIKYTGARKKDEIQKLRGQVLYDLFNSEAAFGLAKGKQSDIEIWYKYIKEMLDPDVTLLSEIDQQKAIAALTREKARIDGTPETSDLFERLIEYL